jgi:hypothetical protein
MAERAVAPGIEHGTLVTACAIGSPTGDNLLGSPGRRRRAAVSSCRRETPDPSAQLAMQETRSRESSPLRAAMEPPVGAFGDVVAALRVIARRHAHDDASPREIRESLRTVTRMARTQGISAAQVIIAAKTAWAAIVDDHTSRDPMAQRARLERLVSLCVDVYYTG